MNDHLDSRKTRLKSTSIVWVSLILSCFLLSSCKSNDQLLSQHDLSEFSFLEYGLNYSEIMQRVGSADEVHSGEKPVAIYYLNGDRQLGLKFGDSSKKNLLFTYLVEEINLPIEPSAQEKPNNQLELSDFYFLEYGMNYKDVVDIIGRAGNVYGEIQPRLICELVDGRLIRIYFQGMERENLFKVDLWQEVILPLQ